MRGRTLGAVLVASRKIIGPCAGVFLYLATAPASAASISGTIQQDTPGNGAASSTFFATGTGADQVRVWLYDSSGGFLKEADTYGGATGAYSIDGLLAGTYYVRVNHPTLSGGAVVAEQTFASAGTGQAGSLGGTAGGGALCVGDAPGYVQQSGSAPSAWVAKAASGTVGGTCFGGRQGAVANSNLTAPPAVGTPIDGEHITRVVVDAANVTNVNFGFSRKAITNANDGGQGSLRAFLANQAGNSGFATRSRFVPAIAPNSSDGTYWTLRPSSTLSVGGNYTIVDMAPFSNRDGTTSIAAAGTVGYNGSTGTGGSSSGTPKPSFEIVGTNSIPVGIDMAGGAANYPNVSVFNLSIWGFGNPANGKTDAQLRYVGFPTGSPGSTIQNVVIGAPPDFSNPGVTQGAGIVVSMDAPVQTSTINVKNCAIGYTGFAGVYMDLVSGGGSLTSMPGNIDQSTIRFNLGDGVRYAVPTTGWIYMRGLLSNNLIADNAGNGIEFINAGGGGIPLQVTNNTISGNGAGGATVYDRSGIAISGTGFVIRIRQNLITQSSGNGITMTSDVASVQVSQNSIGSNAGLGIDLNNDGVTPNDANDVDSGANGLLNFPIIKSTSLSASNLTLVYCAPASATVELYRADQPSWKSPGAGGCNSPDNTSSGRTLCYNEGATLIGSTTTPSSGSACSSYAQSVDGSNQAGMIENTMTVPVPSGYSTGDALTMTSTITFTNSRGATAFQTSEFGTMASPNVSVGTLTLTETSNGGTGTFTYSITNADTDLTTATADSAASITTTQAGVAKTYDADANTADVQPISILALNTNVVLTINAVSGWAPDSTSSCSDTSGNTYPLSGNTITIPAAKVVADLALTCSISHSQAAATAIAGRVFKDVGNGNGTANDGVLNGSEVGLADAGVSLTDCASTTALASAVTDGNGAYRLAMPGGFTGNACVIVALPAGLLNTGGSAGATALPDGTATTVGGTAYTYTRAVPKIQFVVAATGSYTELNFGVVPAASFVGNGRKAGAPGSALLYPHTYTAGSAGSVGFTLAGSGTGGPWSEVLYQDVNCNGTIDAGENPIVAPLAVVAGGQICVILKEFVPLGMTVGAQRTVVVTATQSYIGANPALLQMLSVEDLTTVGDTLLLLDKKVRNVTQNGSPGTSNSAKSGEALEYLVTYTNLSANALNNLVIVDATPAFTTFVSASAGTLPQNLIACTKTTPATSTPVDCTATDTAGGTGGIVWTFGGSLAPGQSGVVSFQVRVQ